MATELGLAYVSILPEMSGFSKALGPSFKKAEKEAEQAGDKAGSGFGSGFKAAGILAAAAAGAAIGAAASSAIVSALNIDKGNDKLAAQLGLTATESKAAGKVAGSLYAGAYGESMEEVNGAVGAVMSSIEGMRTASTADVEAMTTKVLDLSAAFEIDATRAAQVAGQMITSGLAEDGVEAADLLTAALQKVPVAVREDVLDAVDEYGPFFSQLGIEGTDAMGMLVSAAEDGMYGIDKTGDAIKEFGIRATDMSKASGTAYELVGLSQEDMTAKLLAGGDTAAGAFQEIISGVQGIEDPVAQSQAALALFGTPLEDLSVTEIPKFLESLTGASSGLGDVKGAAETMGNTLNDNVATKIEGFKRTIEQKFVTVMGESVIPMVERVIGFFQTDLPAAIQTVMDWFARNRDSITLVASVIGVILLPALARLAIAALVSAAKTVAAFVLMQGSAIKTGAVFVAQSILIIGRWAWMGVQSLIHAGRMAAAWLIAMGPVGWVIAAVVGLAAIVIANWDKISAWTKKAWEAVTKWIGEAWTNIKNGVSAAITWVVNWITTKVTALQVAWRIMWDAIKTKVSDIWNGIKTLVSDAWTNLKKTFNTLIDFVKTAIPDAFEGAKRGIKKAWDAIKEIAKAPVRFVVETVINDGLIGTFNKIPGVNIPKVKLPRGFAHGGYTGDGGKYEAAGIVHKGEYVLTKEETKRLGGAAAVRTMIDSGPSGTVPGAFMGNRNAIARHGAYYMSVASGLGPWGFPAAAGMWDGAAGVRVRVGKGQHQGYVSAAERGGGILGYTTGTNIDMSPSWMARLGARERRTIAAHEIGHALGLPHGGGSSIMQPNLANMAATPTIQDVRNLQRLYPGGSGKAGSGVTNPFNGLIDGLMKEFKKMFPGGGMFIDAAGGLAKSGIESVVKIVTDIQNGIKNLAGDIWGNIKDFFGGGAPADLHDSGGWLGTGRSVIQNNTRKPEAILNNQQWQDISKLALREPVSEPSIERIVLDVGGEKVFAKIVRKGERQLVGR